MGKDPAFLFYPGDFMGGTGTFNFEERGAYITLLCDQFENGALSVDDIKNRLGAIWERIWPRICKKFELDASGNFFNKRLESEKIKRKIYTKTRIDNLNSKKNTHKEPHMRSEGLHMDTHMENENRNRNSNEIVIEKEKDKDKKKIPEIEEFLDHCKVTLQHKYPEYEFSLRSKYKTWVDDGWKTGHNKPIKNWKNTINNTIPYLKPISSDEGSTAKHHKTAKF